MKSHHNDEKTEDAARWNRYERTGVVVDHENATLRLNELSSRQFDVAIQIVNYHSKQYLEECLKSLLADLKGSRLTHAIKVVDNASGDDLSKLKKTFQNDPISFDILSENKGFGAGHNYAFSLEPTRSQLTFVLNPDTTIIEQGTVARLVAEMLSDERIGILGPALQQNGERQPWDHGELKGWKARLANLAGSSYYRQRDQRGTVAWVSGAAFVVRTDLYRTLGGFDEHFFLFKEEEDLCLRARQAGYDVVYDPAITIAHVGGGSGASKDAHMAASVAYFNEKHIGKHNFIAKAALCAGEGYHLW